MSGSGVRERLEEYFAVVGIASDAPWLKPPASPSAIEATAVAVGTDLPEDLVELLVFHNGGPLLNVHDWLPCDDNEERSLAAPTKFDRYLIAGELTAVGEMVTVPGPNVLRVAGLGMEGYLYEMDEHRGRLLMMDTSASPPIVPLAVSLTHLIDVHIALARAGHIVLEHWGPRWRVPSAELGELLLAHGIPDVQIGISTWVMHPEWKSFEIFDPSH